MCACTCVCACTSRAVCERLDSERSKEEARLREESDRKLKELRESGQRETEHQQHTLRYHTRIVLLLPQYHSVVKSLLTIMEFY